MKNDEKSNDIVFTFQNKILNKRTSEIYEIDYFTFFSVNPIERSLHIVVIIC